MMGAQGLQAAADKDGLQPPPAAFINNHCVETVNCDRYGAERLLINNKGKKFKMKKGELKEIKGFYILKRLDGFELSFISGALATSIAFASFFMYNILGRLLIIN